MAYMNDIRAAAVSLYCSFLYSEILLFYIIEILLFYITVDNDMIMDFLSNGLPTTFS